MGSSAYTTRRKQIRARYFETGIAESQDAIKTARYLNLHIKVRQVRKWEQH
jgi:hypothetical protein